MGEAVTPSIAFSLSIIGFVILNVILDWLAGI